MGKYITQTFCKINLKGFKSRRLSHRPFYSISLGTTKQHLNKTVTLQSPFSIVDDYEMYEQQKPFSLEDLTALSGFLNTLTYKLLWNRPRAKSKENVLKVYN